MNSMLLRYIARGIEINSGSAVSDFLIEVLNRQYRHHLAAAFVMQQVYGSLGKLRHKNTQIQLYFEILTGSVAASRWQYIMTMDALMHSHARSGSLGTDEMCSLMQILYPDASDRSLHMMTRWLRDSGNVCITLSWRAQCT
eukprot:jgi/Ulvmu1/4429/UM002_0154.1